MKPVETRIKNPRRKADLTIEVDDECTVRFWWKELVQTNSEWHGDIYCVDPIEWTFQPYDEENTTPYDECDWFPKVENTIKSSYAAWALEQQLRTDSTLK